MASGIRLVADRKLSDFIIGEFSNSFPCVASISCQFHEIVPARRRIIIGIERGIVLGGRDSAFPESNCCFDHDDYLQQHIPSIFAILEASTNHSIPCWREIGKAFLLIRATIASRRLLLLMALFRIIYM